MNSATRLLAHKVAHHHYFELFIDLMIIINCILLGMEKPATPWDPDPDKDPTLQIFDWIFTMIFVGEMVIKIIADGVVAHPIFSDREWIMNVSKLDDKEDPKDNDDLEV